MKLYNTLTGDVVSFDSKLEPISMYVCGVTPYSSSHVGHAMSYVYFDTLRRFLEFSGFTVQHVQNFTDIDDKLIAAANDEGTSVKEIAERRIASLNPESQSLGFQIDSRLDQIGECFFWGVNGNCVKTNFLGDLIWVLTELR